MEIIKTGISRPPICLIYGEHKVGKSTFAAGAPSPLFIQTESGLEGIETSAFPLIASFAEFESILDKVERLPMGQYKTLVIDSADWLERLIHRKVCAEARVADIGQISYGKGHTAAEAIWSDVIDRLTIINKDKKMIIMLLAHAVVEKFEDPERDGYHRVLPDLHKKSVNLLCEFVDILGYCALKIATVEKNGTIKAKTSGERVLYLESRGGFTAGNRYGLSPMLPLSWDAIAAEMKAKGRAGLANNKSELAAVREEHTAAKAKAYNVMEQAILENANLIGEK